MTLSRTLQALIAARALLAAAQRRPITVGEVTRRALKGVLDGLRRL